MKITVSDIVVAEGNEMELAIYTHLLFELIKIKEQHDEQKGSVQTWQQRESFDLNDLLKDFLDRERDEKE